MSRSSEDLWLDIVSGGGGAAGGLARGLLLPWSWAYGASALAYRRTYEVGLRRHVEPALPLLSVGALSVGGAGKTTVATYLAREAAARGVKPAVVLRGYRRADEARTAAVSDGSGNLLLGPREAGDEAVLLARACPEAVVAVGRRREEALAAAAERGATAALLDDGFQYFRLRRDVDLVLVNALQGGRQRRVFPAGALREPAAALSRASQVWITYARSAGDEAVAETRRWCRRHAPDAPQVLADHRVVGCRSFGGGDRVPLDGARVLAFCGLGSPEGFRTSLEGQGPREVRLLPYPDHHWYGREDLEALAAEAASWPADAVVTTAKDAVRLPADAWPAEAPPLAVLEIELEILEGMDAVQEAMARWLAAAGQPQSS